MTNTWSPFIIRDENIIETHGNNAILLVCLKYIKGGHDVRYRTKCTVPGFFVYGTVRYKVGVYGIFQVLRKKF